MILWRETCAAVNAALAAAALCDVVPQAIHTILCSPDGKIEIYPRGWIKANQITIRYQWPLPS